MQVYITNFGLNWKTNDSMISSFLESKFSLFNSDYKEEISGYISRGLDVIWWPKFGNHKDDVSK